MRSCSGPARKLGAVVLDKRRTYCWEKMVVGDREEPTEQRVKML